MLRSNFQPNSGAESSGKVRIVAAPNLLTMAFYLKSKIINDSHALAILWLVIHSGTNQPNWSQTQVSCSMYLAKRAFVFYPNCLMFQQQLPITSCVRPQNRWETRWEKKRWKKLKLTRGRIFGGKKTRDGSSKPWSVSQSNYGLSCGQSQWDNGRKIVPSTITAERSAFDMDVQQGLAKRAAHKKEKNTIFLEQNNSISRHYLGRMTGRSKIGSRSEEMISLSMARWQALTQAEIFQDYQTKFISILKWTLSELKVISSV